MMAMAHSEVPHILIPYSSSSNSSSSSDNSSSSDDSSSEEDRINNIEIFYVDKILDIRWIQDQNGQELAQYRVSWHGYKSSNDSWEPEESFNSCRPIFQEFLDFYESLRAKRVAYLNSIGVAPNEADTRQVNILSCHIDRITQKRWKKKNISNSQTMYKVIWKGQEEDYTWETDSTLAHAQDKVEEYTRQQRLMRLKVHANMKEEEGGAAAEEEDPDHVRRSQERKFFEDLENGELELKGDLYTRVKSRRARTQSDSKETSIPEETQSEKPKCKYIRRQNSRDASNYIDVDERETVSVNNTKVIETQLEVCKMLPRITTGLPQYDPDDVEEEFKKMEHQTVILSEEEFQRAVYANNYELVFDSLRSDNVPDVEFTALFLDMTRHSKREIALLLASRVPDLTVLDLWGENALTITAKQGDISFAYSLLRLGIPLNLSNRENQTPYEVAALYGNTSFCKFCKNFSSAQNVPLT